MNNIREIILKQSVQNNYGQKIIKIRGKCEKGDGDIHSKYHNIEYSYGVCKNCKNIMHNLCKGNKYCVLCVNIDDKQIVCINECNQKITHYTLRLCNKCDKMFIVIFHGGVPYPCVHYLDEVDYFFGRNDNIYCRKCWANRK